MNVYPRVLLISHNAFSFSKNNGKTFNLLFKGWDPNSLAQLYFSNELPESSTCFNYYRITDMDIIDSIFKKNKNYEVGNIINSKKDSLDLSRITTNKIIKNNKFKKNAALKYFRDSIWLLGKWDTPKLQNWLKEFSPQVILFAVGDASFSSNIVYNISRKFDIPLCLYYGDDYYLNQNANSLFKILHNKRTLKAHDRNLYHSSKLFAIGDLMAKEYEKKYHRKFYVIRTGVDEIKPDMPIKTNENRITLSYVGGIHLNRWKSLIELGEILRKVQNIINKEIILNIYTLAIPDRFITEELNKKPLNFCGAIYGKEVNRVLMSSDILVHVESFDKEYRALTRLSISTKIPEYLASGKCILCFGPNEVASIKLIEENEVGLTITDNDGEKEINEKVVKILIDKQKREIYGSKAKKFAEENFNRKCNNELLRFHLNDAIISL